MKQPTPTWNGKPLTPEERKQAEQILARKKSLADVARDRLDEMDNLVAGKPAPAIDGTGMDGKPLKLSDYRGKVVLLVFWGTWCGPCMAEVPQERELAERLQGQAVRDPGRRLRPRQGRRAQGDEGHGDHLAELERRGAGRGPDRRSIPRPWLPATFVIDAKGLIRHVNLRGEAIEKAVDGMIKELEAR